MRNIIIFITTAVLFYSCSTEEQGNVKITGTLIAPIANSEVYLYKVNAQNAIPIDTAAVKEDGSFEMISTIEKLDFYQFGYDMQNRINLGLQPNENVVLSFTSPKLEESYQVQGSPESAKIKQIIDLQISAFRKNDSINRAMQQAGQSNDMGLYMKLNGIAQKEASLYNENISAFAIENSSSISSLIALQQLNPEQNLETFETVVKSLESRMRGHFFYDGIVQQVNALKKIAVGAEAPELAFENPNGKVISLSSLRGQFVLIDFWASWCKPCRIENPNVVKMYAEYKDKGFEILGVSLDQKKDAWINAIEVDGLKWPQISDLGGWSAEPAQIYGVRSIPATILVDPEGIIIAKNLRGPQLEAKLKEVLGA